MSQNTSQEWSLGPIQWSRDKETAIRYHDYLAEVIEKRYKNAFDDFNWRKHEIDVPVSLRKILPAPPAYVRSRTCGPALSLHRRIPNTFLSPTGSIRTSRRFKLYWVPN
jgi:hypothetical protein